VAIQRVGRVRDGLRVELRSVNGDVALEGHDDWREAISIELNKQNAFDVGYLNSKQGM